MCLLVVTVFDPPVGLNVKIKKNVNSQCCILIGSPMCHRGLSSNNNAIFFTKVQTNCRKTMASASNQTKRTLFEGGNTADSSPLKKGRRDENDKSRSSRDKLLSVKKEKKENNGAAAVEIGAIVRACYGTTNAETIVGEQACTVY